MSLLTLSESLCAVHASLIDGGDIHRSLIDGAALHNKNEGFFVVRSSLFCQIYTTTEVQYKSEEEFIPCHLQLFFSTFIFFDLRLPIVFWVLLQVSQQEAASHTGWGGKGMGNRCILGFQLLEKDTKYVGVTQALFICFPYTFSAFSGDTRIVPTDPEVHVYRFMIIDTLM